MARVGFEPTIPDFVRARTVPATLLGSWTVQRQIVQ
jgi:hypothetical protein